MSGLCAEPTSESDDDTADVWSEPLGVNLRCNRIPEFLGRPVCHAI